MNSLLVSWNLSKLNHFFSHSNDDGSDSVVVRLFGVTMDGNSVCVLAHNFVPYLYVQTNRQFAPENIEKAKNALNDCLKSQVSSASGLSKNVETIVVDMEIVHGASIYGYQHNVNQKFLKIFICAPKMFAACRRVLENGIDLCGDGVEEQYQCFEANLDFEIRFMVDSGLVGCGWVELLANRYQVIHGSSKSSRCQLEASVLWSDLMMHDPHSSHEWSKIAPLRILSFDIECLGRKGIFPEPKHDPVIQISNMVKIEGISQPFVRNCFVIGSTAPVIGSDIIVCKNEKEMLEKWADFVRTVDPDFITGYNIGNFDIPYIIDRAVELKCDSKVAYLGRVKNIASKVRELPLASKQMGNRVVKQTNFEGRVVFDVLLIVQRDYKMRSYTLNSVSYHFLGEQKEDVAYTIIADLQNGTPRTRRRLAVYCMKDAYLPLRLLEKLMAVINYIEMARVTGVPLDYLVSRGQQIKVLSQLMRKARSLNFFIPVIDALAAEDTFEGATVIEPVRGFYNEPIATLDFASLYPSIMIAHNLCYTTFLPASEKSVPEGDYITTPSNNRFVKPSLRQGLLPQILGDLLSARKRAKEDLKNETDPFRKMVLNGRQLALKISANSVYGFTGATVGKLPCLELSQSVTAFGRQMIDLTKSTVESTYTKGYLDNKCPADAQVIYGDTDSVMVKFGVKEVSVAMELGLHASIEVSKKFKPPIKLEFEKVYCPFLLISKKRYAGLYFTKPDKYDKLDCKGLETVRRDNCPLVSKVLSTCLEKLLLERDATSALEYAKKVISDLLCNRIDISELIISKELTRASTAYTSKLAHVVLAERMKARDPGSAPRLGDRVPYVIVARGQKTPAYEKAEDPIFVLQNNIPIDSHYYLHNQLAKPLARIFEPVVGDRAEQLLTAGSHTRVRSVTQSKVSGLSQFFQKTERCLICKANMPKGQKSATCRHCKSEESKAYVKQMALTNAIENRFARLWTECQNCAGTMGDEVLCSSRDCPIFYMREKVRTELAEQMKSVVRFNLSTW
ncbi:hypothetical protein AB6A40_003711 [Gnathostoma spinigerum]|uniref:DNA polymerase n=1 Tax=Gnathostoma spinigerum TaxID=75299 RepID=A0ABD6EKA4_9BILA